jgi:hypothetical protein
MNVRQEGNIILYLPVENNGTNQALTLITTLNSYIATSLGVGSAITLT